MRILLLIACLSFSGCGMLGEVVLNSMKGKNPEIKRLELQKETTSEGIQAIKDPAIDEEKAKQIVRLVEGSQRQGHPSFFSAIVSGIHTEEGQRLAGITIVALSGLGVAIWKVVSTWGLPGIAVTAIRNIQEIKEQYPKGSPERNKINDTLKLRQIWAGNQKRIDRLVKKTLGES